MRLIVSTGWCFRLRSTTDLQRIRLQSSGTRNWRHLLHLSKHVSRVLRYILPPWFHRPRRSKVGILHPGDLSMVLFPGTHTASDDIWEEMACTVWTARDKRSVIWRLYLLLITCSKTKSPFAKITNTTTVKMHQNRKSVGSR